MDRTIFHHQFEAVVRLNWTPQEKATHLLGVLQGQATDILHIGPAEAMYKDVQVLKDHCGDNHLAARIPCCHQAVGPLGLCQATPALYPEGGRLCIC